MNFVPFDIVALILIIIMAIRGGVKGFIAEIMSVAAVLFGIAAALIFTGKAAQYTATYMGDTFWNPIVAFLLVFLVVYFIVKLLENMLYALIEKIKLEKLDQALGLFLGICEGIIIVTIVIVIVQIAAKYAPVGFLLEGSIIASIILNLIPYGTHLLHETINISNR